MLTPAEMESAYSSARLAGRRVKGRQSSAVLANLGWNISDGQVRKAFHRLGIEADFDGGYFDYSDDDHARLTGKLEFRWLKYDPNRKDHRYPLSDVPPIILSEVLRDLDLVTAVAHASDDDGTSKEVLRRRGDLVRSTCGAIGLPNIRVDELYVHVQGSLTSYKIHLATGAIYMANGQYLCIIPAKKQQNSVFLPFEDGNDGLMSEIISKTLLLANDTLIGDATIRAQIAVS